MVCVHVLLYCIVINNMLATIYTVKQVSVALQVGELHVYSMSDHTDGKCFKSVIFEVLLWLKAEFCKCRHQNSSISE